MTCEPGDEFAQGEATATADGVVSTDPVVLTAAGYYTYVTSSPDQVPYSAQRTDCGIEAETTLVTPRVGVVEVAHTGGPVGVGLIVVALLALLTGGGLIFTGRRRGRGRGLAIGA